MCGDIIWTLKELERNDINVDFVANNWDILPKFKLEEASNLSIAHRLAELEDKFHSTG